MTPDSGTLVVPRPTHLNEGAYQCFAWNDVGTAMTNETNAKLSVRASFPYAGRAFPVQATLGDRLQVECQPTVRGVPRPSDEDYSWRDDSGRNWPTDSRVQIDDMGMYVD